MTSEYHIPHSAAKRGATVVAPSGATDCHLHFFDTGIPPAPRAKPATADSTPAQYRLLQQAIGTSRCVAVQPSTYGFDNTAMLAGIAQIGASARGVAVVQTTCTMKELQHLHDAGVRGVRVNLVQGGPFTLDDVRVLSSLVAPLGWHVQLHMKARDIADAYAMVSHLPSMLVLDHMALLDSRDPADPGMAALLRLLEVGGTWIKLSAPYLASHNGPPGYGDFVARAAMLLRIAPERMLWGSDWPHATEQEMPADARIFDLIGSWAPDAAARDRVLVDNPAALYGFAHRTG